MLAAILICPFTHTVASVEYSGSLSGHSGAYQLIGCQTVEAVGAGSAFPDGTLYCDEEARLVMQEGARGFTLPGLGQTIVGRALLIGPPDDEGNDTACPYEGSAVAKAVIWVDDIPDYEPWVSVIVR